MNHSVAHGAHSLIHVRFEVLKAITMKTIVFFDVASCSLLDIYESFGGTCCNLFQNLKPNVEKVLWI
jgi:hypothetical protein